MTDSQNKTVWNDWANYVLSIIKKHDSDIDKNEAKLNRTELEIDRLKENKLSRRDFEKFLSEDYIIFKTTVLTRAKTYGAIWGVIVAIITSIAIALINNFLGIL